MVQSINSVGNDISRKFVLFQKTGRNWMIIIIALYVALLAFTVAPICSPRGWTSSQMSITSNETGTFTCDDIDLIGNILPKHKRPFGLECDQDYDYNSLTIDSYNIKYGLFDNIYQSHTRSGNFSYRKSSSKSSEKAIIIPDNFTTNNELPYGYQLWGTLNPSDVQKIQSTRVYFIASLVLAILQIACVIKYYSNVKKMTEIYSDTGAEEIEDANQLVLLTICKGIRAVLIVGLCCLLSLVIAMFSWLLIQPKSWNTFCYAMYVGYDIDQLGVTYSSERQSSSFDASSSIFWHQNEISCVHSGICLTKGPQCVDKTRYGYSFYLMLGAIPLQILILISLLNLGNKADRAYLQRIFFNILLCLHSQDEVENKDYEMHQMHSL